MYDTDKYPTLAQAYRWSVNVLTQMRQYLSDLSTASEVFAVAVSGSLGRFEGMSHSDCDLIVVVSDAISNDAVRCQQIMQQVWQLLEPLELPLPKAGGIYAKPTSPEQICDHATLGLVADDKNIFGKRMQILLDARPVYQTDNFNSLVQQLLHRYAAGFLIYDQRKEWVYLLNDLIRYFRSYCAWHQFDLSYDAVDSWYMRNAKLNHSRLMMFAALILLLGECSKERRDKIGWLNDHIPLTPMQRIEKVYALNNDDNFAVLLDAYESFMQCMSSSQFRASLIDARPASFDELANMDIPAYEELGASADSIMKELTRFTLARRNDWSEKFFEYLLF